MYTIDNMVFKRKFSVNLFKDTRLELAKMSFTKDWLSNDRGDPYPVLNSVGDISEKILNNKYAASGKGASEIRRLIGQYVPFATYEAAVCNMDEGSSVGISVICDSLAQSFDVYMKRVDGNVRIYCCVNGVCSELTDKEYCYRENMALSVTSHHGDKLDVFVRYDDYIEKVKFFGLENFEFLRNERAFKNTTTALYVGFDADSSITVSKAEMYIDAGMSQADMKPVRYENGQPIMENGKLFMTMTSRLGSEMYQSVLSWNPSTCSFGMEGVLLFDIGDGDWCGDVASSLIFDRREKNWKIWMVSFSHNHILGYAQLESDPRFGINVIDVTLMDQRDGSADTDFYAKFGDEDPDFYYDDTTGKWYMTICRSDSLQEGKYSYFLFESDNPFEGYKFISKTFGDAVTGGMFTVIGGKRYFICGANGDKRAQYNIYDCKDFTKCSHIKCDFDDGGFRGWGTVIPVPCGTRTKYIWITFDRHNASDYNWSYGTLYVYEADLMNPGYEW